MKKVTHFKQYISTWKMQKANYSKVACTTQKNVAYRGGKKSIDRHDGPRKRKVALFQNSNFLILEHWLKIQLLVQIYLF